MKVSAFYLIACIGLLGLAVLAWGGSPLAAIAFGVVTWLALTLFAVEEARYED